ncbi:MAG: hypothetical protein AB1480_03260 [Nitrospirota bacterium]
MASVSELQRRAEADDRLYERYAKSLEDKHKGEFVAISRDGQVIWGKDDVAVLREAIKNFGSGNFALRRVGSRAIGKWRRVGDQ